MYRLWEGTPTDVEGRTTLARYKLKKADWAAFTRNLAHLSTGFDTGGHSVDESAVMMTQLLHKAAEGAIRRHGPKPARYARWWCEYLAELQKTVRRARRRFQRAMGNASVEELHTQYKVARNHYHRAIRQAKENSLP